MVNLGLVELNSVIASKDRIFIFLSRVLPFQSRNRRERVCVCERENKTFLRSRSSLILPPFHPYSSHSKFETPPPKYRSIMKHQPGIFSFTPPPIQSSSILNSMPIRKRILSHHTREFSLIHKPTPTATIDRTHGTPQPWRLVRSPGPLPRMLQGGTLASF